MKILKGQKLLVGGGRGKGNYIAKASADFDTETDEWYPVVTLESVDGITRRGKWQEGDSMPCRNGIDTILRVLTDEEVEKELGVVSA